MAPLPGAAVAPLPDAAAASGPASCVAASLSVLLLLLRRAAHPSKSVASIGPVASVASVAPFTVAVEPRLASLSPSFPPDGHRVAVILGRCRHAMRSLVA